MTKRVSLKTNFARDLMNFYTDTKTNKGANIMSKSKIINGGRGMKSILLAQDTASRLYCKSGKIRSLAIAVLFALNFTISSCISRSDSQKEINKKVDEAKNVATQGKQDEIDVLKAATQNKQDEINAIKNEKDAQITVL
jgi:hypothetical protein